MQAQKEAGKVFVASAIGAAIGSLVALQVHANFWWIGLLVGGMVGYLSYEWKEVIRAIPIAARAVFPALMRDMSECGEDMREAWAWTFGRQRPFVYLHLLFNTVFSFLVSGDMYKMEGVENFSFFGFFVLSFLNLLILAGLSFVLFMGFYVPYFLEVGNLKDPDFFLSETSYLKTLKMHFLGIPKAWVKILWQLVSAMTTGSIRFAWKMFLLIHSERRLLCGMDAMIGSCVGYFAGSVLVGALAGGILGVVNYVYVTERVLRPRGFIKAAS